MLNKPIVQRIYLIAHGFEHLKNFIPYHKAYAMNCKLEELDSLKAWLNKQEDKN